MQVCIAIVNFVVAVIEMLDGMKKGKENYAAREAIKFLERELQSGNKFIRAQKFHETLQPGKRKPAKMDTQAWYAFTIDGFMQTKCMYWMFVVASWHANTSTLAVDYS